ncbi:SDR family oxidoreductase [Pseudonocardia humida]|uniref:SDR family NAD(P)-dependent oxidoreductase n=1 Tax=Pseudonocardia humida TaxID=2800819 RepID=A0ABT1AA06_9PSEU|nr:SDR family oxidoreductase [Pseudonocardia humida]MCO1659781.1 SDR family NAD(P)-dependent oxidoreductase [Pseudonocardia humida]
MSTRKPNVQLKPVGEQIVVVMGASSGIGRATALRFAEQGAKVVVAARGKPGLASLVAEITGHGGEATAVPADVTDPDQVQAVADRAVSTYGRLDTWVHTAGVLLVAGFDDTTAEEFARVVQVNLLGQVHGAKAALPHLRQRGGAFISMSSMGAKRSIPLQTAYCASKHGIDGFLEALRVELQRDGVPVSITQIMPGTINTPLFDNARTKTGFKPVAPPPAYPARVVADAIAHAATQPVRDVVVGGSAKAIITTEAVAPRLLDALLRRFGYELHDTGEAKPVDASGNLVAPITAHDTVEGTVGGVTLGGSAYTWWELHRPVTTVATALARPVAALAGRLVPAGVRSAVGDAAATARPTRATAAPDRTANTT